MNKIERAQAVELLKATKQRLQVNCLFAPSGTSEFLCNAITLAAKKRRQTMIGAKLRRLIAKRLGNHTTLDTWLFNEHGITFQQMYADDNRKLQATRHAWLDDLIKEFSDGSRAR